MDGGAWWAAVHGVTKSRTQLSIFTFTFHFHALEKEMATHSIHLGYHRAPSGAPCAIEQVSIGYLFYWWHAHTSVSISVSQFIPPPYPFHLCVLYSCPGNSFISTIFLDSTDMHQNMTFVFLFQTYSILYDRL